MVCSPIHFFNFPVKVVFHDAPYQHHDYLDFPKDVDVIVGASGLHYQSWLRKLELIRKRKTSGKWIAWALGHNAHIKKNVKSISYPDYFSNMDLIGVRDYGTQYPWCPDPTCLSTEFDKPGKLKHKIVIYEHPRFNMPVKDNFPKFDNTKPFDEIIKFLKSAEIILTNTYHGVYWSILLKKHVIGFPFSSKFYGLKHKIPLCRDENWKPLLKKTFIYPKALEECRKINMDFAAKVSEVLNMEITPKKKVTFPTHGGTDKFFTTACSDK